MNIRLRTAGLGVMAGALVVLQAAGGWAAQITEEDARTIAIADAGVEDGEIISSRARADQEDGRLVYDVEFQTQDYEEYEYEIIAENGMILSASYEAGEGIGNEERERETVSVSLEEAKEIAVAHAGAKMDEVTFGEMKTETDDGRSIHEIAFFTEDSKEYEYQVEEATGDIHEWDYNAEKYILMQENEQNTGKQEDVLSNSSAQEDSLEAAKAAALERAGLTSEEVVWSYVHEDYEDGCLIYEGKFCCGNQEYEFEVDAATGAVIDWEAEYHHDESDHHSHEYHHSDRHH